MEKIECKACKSQNRIATAAMTYWECKLCGYSSIHGLKKPKKWYVAIDRWGSLETPDKLISEGLSKSKAIKTVYEYMRVHPND